MIESLIGAVVDAVVALDDEHVGAADRFTEPAADLAVGELDEVVVAEFDVEVVGHLLGEFADASGRSRARAAWW